MLKLKHTFFLCILISLTLSACTQPAEDPKTIADKYWQHLQAGNTIEAEKLVSINSRRAFSEHSSRIDSNTRLNNGETTTIVSTTITSVNPGNNYTHTETFNTVLVFQQGQWKIDIDHSKIPPAPGAREQELQQLTDELSESMQKNIESIDKTLDQGMQMLNEALHEGSQEMGDSLLHLMNELNNTMHESIDKMKQRRQQEQEQQPQEQPDPRQGEGMI